MEKAQWEITAVYEIIRKMCLFDVFLFGTKDVSSVDHSFSRAVKLAGAKMLHCSIIQHRLVDIQVYLTVGLFAIVQLFVFYPFVLFLHCAIK